MSGASMLGSAWNSASASFDIAFRPRFHMLCFGLCERLGLEMLILRVQGRLDNHQIHAIRRKLTILKARFAARLFNHHLALDWALRASHSRERGGGGS